MLKEFKPALAFLGKFLSIYFLGNILYGLFIESYGSHADIITEWVTTQTSLMLNFTGSSTHTVINGKGPTVFLQKDTQVILNVFEGCNGINIIIIFIAFLLAFGGPTRKMAWFLPLGILIIHLSNLLRLSLLYFTAQHYEHYFYFVHKYFFTAVLYLIIFALWAIWVIRFNGRRVPISKESKPDC